MNNEISYIKRLYEILIVSTRLGLTSFGGPVAHLGYFHEEYVRRKKWVDEASYTDLVTISQFLPGPASSQVGIGIGIIRGGIVGGIVAFIGFTMPSVIGLIIFALLLQGFDVNSDGWIHGLKIVAVVVVAHALIGMAKNFTPDNRRKAIALLALTIAILLPSAFTQVAIIVVAAVAGYVMYRHEKLEQKIAIQFPISRRFGAMCIALFFILLAALPILSKVTSSHWVAIIDSFYRAGALVFGGGHVVLPLLQNEFVPTGMISEEAFLAGYGATQAVPGPLFTFAAYIGAVMDGWLGGIVATIAIFLPAFLLILGALPFWSALREHNGMNSAFQGVNAAVVGILLAALYDPIWTSAILDSSDFAFAAILFSLLVFFKFPPWTIVVLGAIGGATLMLL